MKEESPNDFFADFSNIKLGAKLASIAWELSAEQYSPKVGLGEFAIRCYNNSTFGQEQLINEQKRFNEIANKPKSVIPTFADVITLLSLGFGLWWAAGGPVWAGLLSILGDEIDGRVARAMGTTSERGSLLDWGSDVALTSASLVRLGMNTGRMPMAIIAAPVFLFAQSQLRSEGYRPPIGSARAVIMLSTMVIGKRV